jgi:hypothetical protein
VVFKPPRKCHAASSHDHQYAKHSLNGIEVLLFFCLWVRLNSANEQETNDEIIYKIQLGAYSRGLPSYVKSQFKKLSYIRKIEDYTDGNGVVVYTTGNLITYDDALKMQNQIRQEGVEDAFVVPYFNGKRITLKEAKKIEAGK